MIYQSNLNKCQSAKLSSTQYQIYINKKEILNVGAGDELVQCITNLPYPQWYLVKPRLRMLFQTGSWLDCWLDSVLNQVGKISKTTKQTFWLHKTKPQKNFLKHLSTSLQSYAKHFEKN